MISLYMRIDQIMIKEELGNHEVGLYAASIKLVEIWYFIPTIMLPFFQQLSIPKIIKKFITRGLIIFLEY